MAGTRGSPTPVSRIRWAAIAAAAIGAAVVPDGAGAQSSERAIHLLSRATFGVRPADVAAVQSAGIEAWLDAQLHPERIDDTLLDARLTGYPLARADVSTLIRDYSPLPRPALQPGDTAGARRARQEMTAEQRRELQMRSPQRILADLVGAKLQRSVHSARQLEEMMTDFWYNHFNVFFNKPLDRYLVGDYERTGIRPHVFGRFEDMLIATAQHPAMLFYLDNFTSAAPDSVIGRDTDSRRALIRRLASLSEAERERLIRSGRVTREQLDALGRLNQLPAQRREPGINENYARELLELHTLGVDGGYTQADIIEVARAFTGWTIVDAGRGRGSNPARRQPGAGRSGQPAMENAGPAAPRFGFRPEMHDPRAKAVLGMTLPAGRGIEDGLDVLRMLAHHPTTARFLSTKLVQRFVNDAGDAALVDELTAVFLRTGGDLREVTRTLFSVERFYADEHRGVKVKTPFELVAGALRVTRAQVGPSRRLIETLRTLGQLPYMEPAPTGYPVASDEWVNSGALLNRMNFALVLADGGIDGVRVDRQALPGSNPGTMEVARMIEVVLPGVTAAPIEARVTEDLAAQTDTSRRALEARALGLVLGSPEFQRR
ncbi:MAG: DUF1800 domain-containing protein [Gemmatimonadetes bacterium]|nr:DUF1800 domain-containing protein [Gemmatimonadota bacterium]